MNREMGESFYLLVVYGAVLKLVPNADLGGDDNVMRVGDYVCQQFAAGYSWEDIQTALGNEWWSGTVTQEVSDLIKVMVLTAPGSLCQEHEHLVEGVQGPLGNG